MREKRVRWTVVAQRPLYRNPWIAVHEDQVVQPDGRPGVFGIVEMVPAVAVLPVAGDGTVTLVQVFRYTLNCDSIETIAGGIGDGESPEEAARRELHEEAGIIAGELLSLGITHQMTEVVVSPVHLFVARGLSQGAPQRDATEDVRRLDVSLRQAVEWALDGTIIHAATVGLILRAAHLFDTQS
jgi:8-oxo-dGTP pyrophosphatase MutT (NUDIX family)